MATRSGRVVIAVLGVLVSALAFALSVAAQQQQRQEPARVPQISADRVGRPPTADQLRAVDIDVEPDGRGLPAGHGTPDAGKQIFDSRCTTCHGATGREGPQDVLAGGIGTLASAKPLKTVGSFWPYATTLWDYVSRAMPFDRPGTLTHDDVYAVTAYLLYLNGIVDQHAVVDQTTLPRIQMPNRDGFVPDPRPDTGTPARRGRSR